MNPRSLLLLVCLFYLPALAAPIKPVDERGGDPRSAWRRLGPEAKEAFVVGLQLGLTKATELQLNVEPDAETETIVAAIDLFYEDGTNTFTPWWAAVFGEVLADSLAVGPLHDQARTEWLADHPKAAQRARRGSGNAARLPRAESGARKGSICSEFQRWLYSEFLAAEGRGDAALVEKILAGGAEVAGGRVQIEAGEVREHRERRFEDYLFHFVATDTSASSCDAVVVFVDGVPTRVDGIPETIRKKAQRGQ